MTSSSGGPSGGLTDGRARRNSESVNTRSTVSVKARAKINLALHVTGRREDGYHLLDSLVVFAGVGDQLNITPAEHTCLEISGPFGDGLRVEKDNLVFQAFQHLSQNLKSPLPPTAFHLEKNLPVSSGIGGGSADAAAALKGLVDLWQIDIEPQMLAKIALSLGADVPVCLTGTTCRMRGIGQELTGIDDFPAIDCVLVNPGVGVSTPAVFRQLSLPAGKTAFAAMADLPANAQASAQANDWVEWLGSARNDLQEAAATLAPEIHQTIAALEQDSACQMARMSGSGATCFGLFGSPHDAGNAAAKIADAHPDWWVIATQLGSVEPEPFLRTRQ